MKLSIDCGAKRIRALPAITFPESENFLSVTIRPPVPIRGYTLGGFNEFENCRFLDFDRPVYRFQAVFSANRHDHRVSEVKAVQNIYTLGGF